MKRTRFFLLLIPVIVLLAVAEMPGLDRYDSDAYGFHVGYPMHWKVEERKLGTGDRPMGEVSFLHHTIRPSTKWTFFKVVANGRDSTSTPFKGIADLVGDKGTYREAVIEDEPIKLLVDEGETTWLLCDKLYDNFSYSFSFRIQGKLDTDSWLGIKMVLKTFGRAK